MLLRLPLRLRLRLPLLLLVLLEGLELRQVVLLLLRRGVTADTPAEVDGAMGNSRRLLLPRFSSRRRRLRSTSSLFWWTGASQAGVREFRCCERVVLRRGCGTATVAACVGVSSAAVFVAPNVAPKPDRSQAFATHARRVIIREREV